MFVFQADPPDNKKIPVGDAVGVTVVLITCGYKGQEFVRVGYYVNNAYTDPELQENPPDTPIFEKLTRTSCEQPQRHEFSIDLGRRKDHRRIFYRPITPNGRRSCQTSSLVRSLSKWGHWVHGKQ
ncbi:UNVERIFIED_CONTAM: hypothetical protein GTU68_032140 [Idotea baltica]|nr:hypothetical protein [Idotea baltica]